MHAVIILKKAKRNKVFKEGTIDGYKVAIIDGAKLFGSNKKIFKLHSRILYHYSQLLL